MRPAAADFEAFLGRISPEKRPDRAIAIANALGLPLRIAAKVDKVDEAYFREDVITPLLGQRPAWKFVGEDQRCNILKQNSSATHWRCCFQSIGRNHMDSS